VEIKGFNSVDLPGGWSSHTKAIFVSAKGMFPEISPIARAPLIDL